MSKELDDAGLAGGKARVANMTATAEAMVKAGTLIKTAEAPTYTVTPPSMTRDRLFALHTELCAKGLEIMRAKNHDYTGSGGPFDNFRVSERRGVPGEIGLLLRVDDKLSRIQTFIQQGTLLVKGEGVQDAILDVINYMVLLAGMIEERRGS